MTAPPPAALAVPLPGAADPPRWQPDRLLPADLDQLIAELLALSADLHDRYAGRVDTLAADALRELLDGLGDVRDRISALSAAAVVAEATAGGATAGGATAGGAASDGAVAERVQLAIVQAVQHIGFFDEEWTALAPERAAAMADAPELSLDAYLLRSMNRVRQHLLPPAQEAVLSSRDESASDAWIHLYRQTMAETVVELDGARLPMEEALRVRRTAQRPDERRRAAEAVHRALQPSATVVAACYDAVVADRLAIDALRDMDHPRRWTDLENDLVPDQVEQMLAHVERHNDLARQWFGHKARRLGLTRLTSADEHAPLAAAEPVSWGDAVRAVLSAFAAVSPVIGAVAAEVADDGRIDALPRVGKPGNAYCYDAGRRCLPLISINFDGQPTGALSLAHELGHAVHFVLAGRRQSGLSYDGSTVLAESAAMLLELAARKHLMAAGVVRVTPATAMQASIDAVFRQVMLTRFEERAYATRADGTRLTAPVLTEIWQEVHRRFYGESLEILPSFALDWMRIEHFIQSRFYNYAYVAAHLFGLAVASRLPADDALGDALGDGIVELLSTGGSASPRDQYRLLSLDLDRGEPWRTATDELAATLTVAVDGRDG
jgi:oligoendopeptidase F